MVTGHGVVGSCAGLEGGCETFHRIVVEYTGGVDILFKLCWRGVRGDGVGDSVEPWT